MAEPVFAACWKVVELGARVDPLSGEVLADPRSLGVSAADEAALEWALRCAERAGGTVRLVSAGGPEADAVLRLGKAAGAGELVRVPVAAGARSETVALALAPALADARLVWCGDVSVDRGTGSVPAYLADELGIAQALGLVAVDLPEHGSASGADGCAFEVLRRLDGGRRERLLVAGRAVVSCEGGTARLRRAPLPGLLASRGAPVEVRPAGLDRAEDGAGDGGPRVVSVSPFRPRTRVVPPPPGSSPLERIRALTRVGEAPPAAARAVTATPDEAARLILEALEAWGELP